MTRNIDSKEVMNLLLNKSTTTQLCINEKVPSRPSFGSLSSSTIIGEDDDDDDYIIQAAPAEDDICCYSIQEMSTRSDDSFETIDDNKPPVIIQKPRFRSTTRLVLTLLSLYFATMTFLSSRFSPWAAPIGILAPNSVYVPGGGFSGFWFTLGRLQSIPHEKKHDLHYYCYSAGCLGVVAHLSNYSMEEMYDMAHDIQLQWRRGDISRYQVVRTFLDRLLPNQTALESTSSRRLRVTDLPKLHILTTTRGDGWWKSLLFRSAVRTPTTRDDLHEMLLQTTWIPGAIGAGLWHVGHMDGAFSVSHHPVCQYDLSLALDWQLLVNLLNVNLSRKGVEQFWNAGLAYGL